MKKFLLSAFLVLCVYGWMLQSQPLQRPKLVVGVVIDQMRWDYLYRYYDRYAPNGGFKRILNQGFTCENTYIPYAPTVTACGHASIYTGSVPAITGITGNFWWDNQKMAAVYCTEDKSVKTVGSGSSLGLMSPRNLLVTTIGDELKLATNFRSKVIGISLKDRGGILPAGHSADAAYWYDNTTGAWITSTYYMNELPSWVMEFNSRKLVDKYYTQGWNLLYPAATYRQSTVDEKSYESKPFGKSFPYDMKNLVGKNYSSVSASPFGNSLTTEFAKVAITNEKLGMDSITDLLAVSYSSPDYIGHSFGPNSIEAEDGFLRLDKELGELLDYLDSKVGKSQYLFFLSADHGVSQVPEFMQENKLPGQRVFVSKITEQLNSKLEEKYGVPNIIVSDDNYQLHLNHRLLDSVKIDQESLNNWIVDYLALEPGIARAFPLEDLNEVPLPFRIREMLNNGYFPKRNGDIQIILHSHFIDAYGNTGTTHGLWNPYDSHIPLLWYGWGIKPGKTNRETYMTDITPTIAALLRIQVPSGSVGTVITEVVK
ncbi:MAG TPA: alkaline phosphatase PafA [Chitinophagaceae bacterium]|nr:alkaline phosphatase PafA [Chitinophagaceae bacterium]